MNEAYKMLASARDGWKTAEQIGKELDRPVEFVERIERRGKVPVELIEKIDHAYGLRGRFSKAVRFEMAANRIRPYEVDDFLNYLLKTGGQYTKEAIR